MGQLEAGKRAGQTWKKAPCRLSYKGLLDQVLVKRAHSFDLRELCALRKHIEADARVRFIGTSTAARSCKNNSEVNCSSGNCKQRQCFAELSWLLMRLDLRSDKSAVFLKPGACFMCGKAYIT